MDRKVLKGEDSPWGALAWKSRKFKRPAGSSMAGETQAMLKALGRMEYTVNMILEIFVRDYSVAKRKDYYHLLTTGHVLDAKSCFDHIKSQSPSEGCEDKFAALDMLQIKSALARTKTILRWAPGTRQLADVLTKDNSDVADTWRAHLSQGQYRLADEELALKMRAQARDARLRRGQDRKKAAEEKATANATKLQDIPAKVLAAPDDQA